MSVSRKGRIRVSICYSGIYPLWTTTQFQISLRNSKIPKGQTEIIKSVDRQDHGKQNETKDKHRTHNTALKTKAGVTRTLQKPG